jgi:hypothetical protein
VNHNSSSQVHFWETCGWTQIGTDMPFPELFCAYDTNRYMNPYLRSFLFTGVIGGLVISIFVIGLITLVLFIQKLKNSN